jgi:riboflavin synthase
MFTGIITDLGTVRQVTHADGHDSRFCIATAYDVGTIDLGASIACNGACLTVVALEDDAFSVDASAETLARTTLGGWSVGTPVNLERALRVGDELGGHMVSGHVDGLAEVVACRPENDSLRLDFRGPAQLAGAIAAKGSVALDGVSLTVNAVEDGVDGVRFAVNIIPHTRERTTLGALQPGDRVNLEIDMLARYVQRLLEGQWQTR